MHKSDNLQPDQRTAYILAGGKSSRFGSSKALVVIDDQRQIQRLANQLATDAWQTVAISQTAKEFDSLGIRTIADIEPDQGPLAGILAGMLDLHANNRSASAWAIFVTCDLWMWNPGWSNLLVPHSVDPESQLGLLHYFQSDVDSEGFLPFPCSIHIDALPKIQNAWKSRCRSMRELIASLAPLAITHPIQEDLLPLSFNTPGDLKRFQCRVARDASHTPQ
jgi:molybdopterin-guanine dinucleotide biosynthesis protein A